MSSQLIFANALVGAMNVPLFMMQLLLFFVSIFLILLVLIQRGKGGGLTGALGGTGGQSAFGSRAGDAFTKITVATAIIWITLCMVTIAYFNPPPRPATSSSLPTATSLDANGEALPAIDANDATTDDEQVLEGNGEAAEMDAELPADSGTDSGTDSDKAPGTDAVGDGDTPVSDEG